MTMPLHTDRIRLRAPEPDDIDEMWLFENDETFWENGPATGPYSRYQLKQYIAGNQNDLFTDGQLRLMIELCSGKTTGIIDLFAFEARHLRAEVGIVVKAEYRRQGIASEALRLLERHCFGMLGIHQLYAYIRTDNAASLRLFEKQGYTRIGMLKDWIRTGNSYKDVCLMQKIHAAQTS